jgi:O-antigen/teichoic acid export membrane protein
MGAMTSPPASSLPRRAAWNVGSGTALIAGRFFSGLVIARLLGPDGSGHIAYFLWLADMGGTVLHFALPPTLTRFQAELLGRGERAQAAGLRRWIWRMFLGLLGAGMLIVALAARASGALPAVALVGLVPFFFFAQSLWALGQADLAGRGEFAVSARVNFFCAAALIAFVSLGAASGGIVGAAWGYLGGAALQATAGFWCAREKTVPAPLPASVRAAVLRYALAAWTAALLSAFAWGRTEIFFLERYCGPQPVAMFTVSLSLVTLFAQGSILFADALTPHFAGLLGAGREAEIRATYARSTRLLGLLLFPSALGGAAVVPVLLPWLYGPAFAPAVDVATILCAAAVYQVTVVGGTLIYGLGRPGFIAAVNLVCAAAVIAAGVTIVPRFGALGAALARVAIQGGGISAGLWFVQRRLGCRVPWAQLARTLLAALVCAAAAGTLVSLQPRPLILLAAIPLGAATYIFAVRLLRAVHPDDIARLREFSGGLPPAIASLWRGVLRCAMPP